MSDLAVRVAPIFESELHHGKTAASIVLWTPERGVRELRLHRNMVQSRAIHYRLILCDTSGKHAPVAIFESMNALRRDKPDWEAEVVAHQLDAAKALLAKIEDKTN